MQNYSSWRLNVRPFMVSDSDSQDTCVAVYKLLQRLFYILHM